MAPIDSPRRRGVTRLSAAHSDQDLERTITAFEKALRTMVQEACFA